MGWLLEKKFAHYAVYSDGKKGLLFAGNRLFVSGNLHIFHQSHEMEIPLRESSRENRTIFLYARMPYLWAWFSQSLAIYRSDFHDFSLFLITTCMYYKYLLCSVLYTSSAKIICHWLALVAVYSPIMLWAMPRDSYKGATAASVPTSPPPLSLRCSHWDDRQNSHSTSGCILMEGRNVVSRTSVIYFDNRSSLLRTLINRCSLNIPTLGCHCCTCHEILW